MDIVLTFLAPLCNVFSFPSNFSMLGIYLLGVHGHWKTVINQICDITNDMHDNNAMSVPIICFSFVLADIKQLYYLLQ